MIVNTTREEKVLEIDGLDRIGKYFLTAKGYEYAEVSFSQSLTKESILTVECVL